MAEEKFLKVAVLDNKDLNVPYVPDHERNVLKGIATVEALGFTNVDLTEENLKDYDGILCWHHLDLSKEVLQRLKKCKVIGRIGMGYDNVDFEAAKELGIFVCNVPDYGVEEVADSAICLILNLMRRTHFVANTTKSGNWDATGAVGATRLNGRVLGIIGLGRIGTATALRAKAFGLNVIYYDPFIEYGRAKALGISQVESLQELLSQSDIISVHCPLKFTKANNYHLLNQENLKYVKKGAFLVNTARGPIVDEVALVEALKDGRLRGAGLDVFEKEPYIEGPLLKLDNVIVTPHTAFYSDQGFVEMVTKAALEVKRVLTNQLPLYCVNGVTKRREN